MGRDYKNIRNGKGTDLIIDNDKYISVGRCGENVTVRGNGLDIAFNGWFDFMAAIDVGKAVYYSYDRSSKKNTSAEEFLQVER